MPKKGTRTPLPPVGDPTDPNSLYTYLLRFLEWMRVRNYSDKTTESREVYLRYFIEWCEQRGLSQPQEITKPIIERYQRYLFHYRKKNGEPLTTRSQYGRLTPVRAWFKWLARENHILYNPASDIELPRLEHRLPQHVLTRSEVETILNQANVTTETGIRDRAILETFYSTGIRRLELINLHRHDLDTERGTLMIRQGKGKKDRMVPIGDRALSWVVKYCDEVRPHLALGQDDGTLFLSHLGEAFKRNHLTQLVRDYVNAANTGKQGSCHLFRHTMATLMLENGADIRFIQAILGHAKVSTTQIYTQVSIRKLKEVHSETHPARLLPSRERQEQKESEEETSTAEDVLEALEAEAYLDSEEDAASAE